MSKKNQQGTAHTAVARALDLPISSKHSVEIARNLRFKNTTLAKKILDGVIKVKIPIPYKRHTKDLGHKAGIGAGRYPEKAAREFLKLINSVEANAQLKGLNLSSLKITKLVANKASVPFTGGRQRRATKRAHLEIEVTEMSSKGEGKKSEAKKDEEKKNEERKTEEKKGASHPEVKHDVKPEVKHSEHKSADIKYHDVNHDVNHGAGKHTAKISKDQSPAELSPAELLKQVQAKAAALNNKQTQTDVHSVENLYDELQKKGTLRK